MPHVLIATDADWVLDEVQAALGGADTTFTVCRTGKQVIPAVRAATPDLAVLDLQIGNMGGIAVTMQLRLDESSGLLPHVPVLILLDRRADLHLARRSGAEGWLIKPLDALRLRRAATRVMRGETVQEGMPEEPAPLVGDAGGGQGAADPPSADPAGEAVVTG